MWCDATLALTCLARGTDITRDDGRALLGRGLLAIIHSHVRDGLPRDRPGDRIRRTGGHMEYQQLSSFAQPFCIVTPLTTRRPHPLPHPPCRRSSFTGLMPAALDPADQLRAAVEAYHRHGNPAALFDMIRHLAETVPADKLKEACVPFIDMPEVVIPVYERVSAALPEDAQAMVVLANAYWLAGRGPEMVGELAARAISADGGNRGAWHLSLSSSSRATPQIETPFHTAVDRCRSDCCQPVRVAVGTAAVQKKPGNDCRISDQFGSRFNPGTSDFARNRPR